MSKKDSKKFSNLCIECGVCQWCYWLYPLVIILIALVPGWLTSIWSKWVLVAIAILMLLKKCCRCNYK
ncbi:MAG: hypothetical protein AABW83_01790 [Nanoarchaeota archaeon]